jgi:hypothetical protein
MEWLCICDCGNSHKATSNRLTTGKTTCCHACAMKKISISNSKNGVEPKKLYYAFTNMKTRCYNKNYFLYHRYGGRGITVCDEWLDSEMYDGRSTKGWIAFKNWALSNGYADDLTIDRIDLYGNYEPSNCRWATMKQQLNNTRQNRHYTHDGVTHTLTEWQDITGIPAQRIKYRVNKGWPEELIFDPENHQKNRVIGRKKNE